MAQFAHRLKSVAGWHRGPGVSPRARILQERGLVGQPLGALTITVAAIDDLFSWILLAAVVAFARTGSAWGSLTPLLHTLLWACPLYTSYAADHLTRVDSGAPADSITNTQAPTVEKGRRGA